MQRCTFTYKEKRHDVRYSNAQDLVKKVINIVETYSTPYTSSSVVLFREWCYEYLAMYKKPSTSCETYTSYLQRVNKHLIPIFGDCYLHEITQRECQLFFSNLRGYAHNTIRKIYNDFNQIMDKAVSLKMIEHNPLSYVELPKGHTNTRRSITPEEREIILKVAEYHHAKFFVLLMLYCGLRPHETALIQGKDIKNKKLHVRGNKNAASDRYVPIPDVFWNVLPKLEPDEYLVKGGNGESPVSETQRAALWKSFKKEMNIVCGCKVYRNKLMPPYAIADDLVPYCLRHTYCTDLQDAGVPINIAKDFMGHCTINLTSRIYTHQTKESFEKSAFLISAFSTPLPHQEGQNSVKIS